MNTIKAILENHLLEKFGKSKINNITIRNLSKS
ncbi:hypothetical protein ACUN90_27790 [Escherichia sp. SP-MK2]